jgi:hypothetical protein
MEREERDRHDIENRRRAQYEADYGHPEGEAPNPDRLPGPRLSPLRRAKAVLKPEMMLTT